MQRLTDLIAHSPTVIYGGESDLKSRFIAPTLIDEPAPDSPVMQEEIFGPILPIIGYRHIEEAIRFIRQREKPLALYYFGNNDEAESVCRHTSSGGMCINDTILHFINRNLPFGGVGNSGYGRYHGRFSFDTFSNPKGVLKSQLWMDLKMRYMPYRIPQWMKRFI